MSQQLNKVTRNTSRAGDVCCPATATLSNCPTNCCDMNYFMNLWSNEVQSKFCCNVIPSSTLEQKIEVIDTILCSLFKGKNPFACNVECDMCDSVVIGSLIQFIQYIQAPAFVDRLQKAGASKPFEPPNSANSKDPNEPIVVTPADLTQIRCLIPYFSGGIVLENLLLISTIYSAYANYFNCILANGGFNNSACVDPNENPEFECFITKYGLNIRPSGGNDFVLADRATGNPLIDIRDTYWTLAAYLRTFGSNLISLQNSCGLDINKYFPDGIAFIGLCQQCDNIDICSIVPPAFQTVWMAEDQAVLDHYMNQMFGRCPAKCDAASGQNPKSTSRADEGGDLEAEYNGVVFVKLPGSGCCPNRCIGVSNVSTNVTLSTALYNAEHGDGAVIGNPTNKRRQLRKFIRK
jgi:hypothetical protein